MGKKVSQVQGIVIPTREVVLPGGTTLEVRGLSLNDLTHLAAKHWEDLAQLMQGLASGVDSAHAMRLALTRAPGLAAAAVAAAAEEPELEEIWDRLPATVQLETFAAVLELTIVDELHLSQALEALVSVVETASRASEHLGGPSISGNGSSPSAETVPLSANAD